MSCPFGAITPSSAFKVALKCDACIDREERSCVAACPTGALSFGNEASYNAVLAARRERFAAYAGSLGTAKEAVRLDYAGRD
jgi:carbon-monoxide dehydrogenase iron sulfur subunit